MSLFYINLTTDFVKRYDFSKFMNYENDQYDILNSYFITRLKKLAIFGQYVVQAQENRPELVSYTIYEDTQYWWILMLYNDLFNFEEFPAGLIINYPSLASLEELYFSLKSLEVN